MSDEVNTRLLERACEVMDNYTGTMWERIVQRDIDSNDLESLHYHVIEAEKQMAIEEDNILLGANDVY